MAKKLLRSKKVSPAALMGLAVPDMADKKDIETTNRTACIMFWDKLQHNNERNMNGFTDMSYSSYATMVRENFDAATNPSLLDDDFKGPDTYKMLDSMPESVRQNNKVVLYSHVKILQQDLKLFKDFSDNGYISFNNEKTMPLHDSLEDGRAKVQAGINNLARRIGTMYPCRPDELRYNVNCIIGDLQSNKNIDKYVQSLSEVEEAVRPSKEELKEHQQYVNEVVKDIESDILERDLITLTNVDNKSHLENWSKAFVSSIHDNLVDLYTLQKTGDVPINTQSIWIENPEGEMTEMMTSGQRMQSICNNLSSQLTAAYSNIGRKDKCYLHPDDFSLTKEQIEKSEVVIKSLQPKEQHKTQNKTQTKERRLPELPDDDIPVPQEDDLTMG